MKKQKKEVRLDTETRKALLQREIDVRFGGYQNAFALKLEIDKSCICKALNESAMPHKKIMKYMKWDKRQDDAYVVAL